MKNVRIYLLEPIEALTLTPYNSWQCGQHNFVSSFRDILIHHQAAVQREVDGYVTSPC